MSAVTELRSYSQPPLTSVQTSCLQKHVFVSLETPFGKYAFRSPTKNNTICDRNEMMRCYPRCQMRVKQIQDIAILIFPNAA
jgi:hypothetical protein